uniref:Uncharacterized protein n=1 Tax=Acrobeloides nanus TaxID=290746 RepID=A0A914EN17_9BILA
MSRILKSSITRCNNQLIAVMNGIETRAQNPRRGAQENLDIAFERLRNERTTAIVDLEKLQNLCEKLNEKHISYENLLIRESNNVPDDADRIENRAYEAYIQATPYINTLAEGEDKIPTLRWLLSTFDRSIEGLEFEARRANPAPMPVPANAGQILSVDKVSLKPFSRKMRDFPEFWDMYTHTIHDRAYPNTDKLVVLKSLMSGDAKNLLDDLKIEDGNYQIAIDKIKACFNDQNALKMTLYNDLYSLPLAGPDVRNLRKSLDEIQRILRQLENAGEDVDQRVKCDRKVLCRRCKTPGHIEPGSVYVVDFDEWLPDDDQMIGELDLYDLVDGDEGQPEEVFQEGAVTMENPDDEFELAEEETHMGALFATENDSNRTTSNAQSSDKQ